MIRLQTNSEDAALTHGVAAARNIANLHSGQHQVFVAHQLRNSGCHLRRYAARNLLELFFACRIIQNVFAKFADDHTADRRKGRFVVSLKDQAGDFVVLRIDQRAIEDVGQRQIGQRYLGRYTFSFRGGGDAC